MLSGDQADTLRQMASEAGRATKVSTRSPITVIAVAGGKGGVGKTVLSANLAVSMGSMGRKVLVVDGDLGLANLDIVLGAPVQHTLQEVVSGAHAIGDVLVQAPHGVTLLAGCSGNSALADLDERGRYALFSAIEVLEDRFDTLVIDTAAGVGANALAFAAAAQKIVIVVTPEPTSFADAYAFVKMLEQHRGVRHVSLVCNMVSGAKEAQLLFARFSSLVDRFLVTTVEYAGYVLSDPAVPRSIRAGEPVVASNSGATASQCIRALATRLLRDTEEAPSGGMTLFWKRVVDSEGET